ASDDPSHPFTPLALRNSRTVLAGISAACAAGAAVGGPATITGLSSAKPANFPSASSTAAPEKPTAGAGDSASSLPLPTVATDALTLLAAAPPPWLCGSTMPVSCTPLSSTPDFAAPLVRPSGYNPR